ncbi:hypothetical protein Tco_1254253 [Tanacetum coccineum]
MTAYALYSEDEKRIDKGARRTNTNSEEPETSKNQGVEPTTEHHEGVQIKSIPPEVGPVIEENVPLIGLKRWCDIFFADPIDGREDEYVWLEAINTPDDLYMRHDVKVDAELNCLRLLDLEGVMLESIVHPFAKPVDHSDAADRSLESVQKEADGATN